jgi:hypothetical protein
MVLPPSFCDAPAFRVEADAGDESGAVLYLARSRDFLRLVALEVVVGRQERARSAGKECGRGGGREESRKSRLRRWLSFTFRAFGLPTGPRLNASPADGVNACYPAWRVRESRSAA